MEKQKKEDEKKIEWKGKLRRMALESVVVKVETSLKKVCAYWRKLSLTADSRIATRHDMTTLLLVFLLSIHTEVTGKFVISFYFQ